MKPQFKAIQSKKTLDTENPENKKNKDYWEEYNDENPVGNYENGKVIRSSSYSQIFFKQFMLDVYLKKDSKILQFGASTGCFLEEYRTKYPVMGYDYSDQAIKMLKSKQLPCRQVNLNDVANVNKCMDLDVDGNLPTNFIAIRIFQYLDDKALGALIFTLLKRAAPDSRFILVNSIGNSPADGHGLTKNYIASFFGARTDTKIMLMSETPKKTVTTTDMHNDDEVLVVQKL
ncbi:SAM-dependent methyltransferase [Legionella hackeliae]|uniref:Methyltransferase domain-containing protein n=1 Tax=Legionella hackeliae TaxID=449 RepID=A0A0A8UM53_LEGHA|nr:SAM-dependent methyltransferase [Legionella hackeliae]KTD10452.1 hypothetical protein Lhac_2820 [Legionella hackeliae]CEK09955.1 protein of unknown function [Legionella hackeliae]STX49868.1 Uncharacterised protein [Legionella hackeliae]